MMQRHSPLLVLPLLCLLPLLLPSLVRGSVPAGDSSAECRLSSLSLEGLTFRDSDGAGFTPAVLEYQGNLAPSDDRTRVAVESASAYADKARFQLTAQPPTNAEATQPMGEPFKQYLHPNTPSADIRLAEGTTDLTLTVVIPSTCSVTYRISLHKQPRATFAVGDPRFAGLRGQEFQVHGVAGEVYNIISDRHVQMNARFVYLDKGSCPVLQGRRGHGCWSHPGSYLGEIGIKTANGDTIRILSGHATEGFEKVTINDRQLKVGASIKLPCPEGHLQGHVWFNSTHALTVEVGHFHLEFENSDLFINQCVRVLDWSELSAHGLLGQTWRKRTYDTPIKFIQGTVDDYLIRNRDIFGDAFLYNQYRDLTQ